MPPSMSAVDIPTCRVSVPCEVPVWKNKPDQPIGKLKLAIQLKWQLALIASKQIESILNTHSILQVLLRTTDRLQNELQ